MTFLPMIILAVEPPELQAMIFSRAWIARKCTLLMLVGFASRPTIAAICCSSHVSAHRKICKDVTVPFGQALDRPNN